MDGERGLVSGKARLAVAATLLVAVLAAATAALAITNGQPDGDKHPYVGLMLAQDEGGNPLWRCSGTLISESLFLTAGHCTDGASHVEIWFDKGPIPVDPAYRSKATGGQGCDDPSVKGYPCNGEVGGTPHTNPDYGSPDNPYGGGNGLPAFSFRDVGVVVLDVEHPMATYGKLPRAGRVDALRNKQAIDFVGYGVQYQAQVPGSELPQPPPYYRWTGPRERMYAPSELVSGEFVHSAEFLRLALNPGGGSGGTCFGDSGGPDFLGGTNEVLGVNSYVTNVNCGGVGYSSRVDVPQVLKWIQEFMDA